MQIYKTQRRNLPNSNMSTLLSCFEIIPVLKPLKRTMINPTKKFHSNQFHVSKIFEKIICNQMETFVSPKFSNLLTGVKKKPHYTILITVYGRVVEKHSGSKKKKKKKLGLHSWISLKHSLLQTISLLIAKLRAYGFSVDSLKSILSYLKNKKQRTVIENSYNFLRKIIGGVSQLPILGPYILQHFCK